MDDAAGTMGKSARAFRMPGVKVAKNSQDKLKPKSEIQKKSLPPKAKGADTKPKEKTGDSL